MTIDPYTRADELGIDIVRANLGVGIVGLYTGKRIILQPGQSVRDERCALAHELGHAKFDQPFIHYTQSAKAEKRADRQAAEWLIDQDRFIECSKYMDPGELAIELNVTARLLKAFIDAHPELLCIASAV